MAQKYLKDEDAEKLAALAREGDVRESDVLSALIWKYGAKGVAAAVKAKTSASQALRGDAAPGGVA